MSETIKLYEAIINKKLSSELGSIESFMAVHKDKLEADTAAALVAAYLQTIIENGLRHYRTKPEDVQKQIDIANALIKQLSHLVADASIENYEITEDQVLRGIVKQLVSKENFFEKVPLTSVARTTLFTGGQHEPPVYSEIKREIASADRIDLLVSFIKYSGLRLIFDDLKAHTRTKQLRVITTSYMGASDFKAVEALAKLPNTQVRVSYDTNRTRLHAKAYYFHRDTGYSTAYIGSSNLSKAALSEGTEWNLKISEYSSPDIINKYRITFDTYWNIGEFQQFDPDSVKDVRRLKQALHQEGGRGEDDSYFFDLVPYAYQQEILDRLDVEREVFGSYINLIVAATGTGKTMVSAFDFKRFYREKPAAKLLFLAHREEILKQSIKAFRGVLKDANFGELWVGQWAPKEFTHVFASIQTLNSNDQFLKIQPDYFDYIVLDETHHSAARTYQKIVNYFKPSILLGLTATPERMDGGNILDDFNGRIAYEIRLREAIERNMLCPFHYFGVTDEVDLSRVGWRNGRYDVEELNQRYIGNHTRDTSIIHAIDKYVTSRESIKGLGFCVSKAHARHMAESFNNKGIPSLHLDSDSAADVRNEAQARLTKGDVRFIFTVDLYNEGVDIPEINTILFLRPTESPTIFIQQLGRGLRLHDNKDVLTVLDFIGQARKEYNYQMKFQSLVGRTRHSIQKELEQDFPTLPRNCAIKLERVARDIVLDNVSRVYNNKARLRQMVQSFSMVSSLPLNLTNFLNHYGLLLQELYKSTTLFELVYANDIIPGSSLWSSVKNLKSAFMKVSKLSDIGLLRFLSDYLEMPSVLNHEMDRRKLLMLYYTIFQSEPEDELENVFQRMQTEKPALFDELIQIIRFVISEADHLPKTLDVAKDVPLELHASYSTDQVLAALGVHSEEKKVEFREGVKYITALNLDVFFITLKKSEKTFKESTRYEDYAINDHMFHWQSQSRTTDNSPTGQRYINMRRNGARVLLFVRDESKDSYGATETFRCLGFAKYINHEGSAPISIVYKLDEKMPMHILRASNQIVDII